MIWNPYCIPNSTISSQLFFLTNRMTTQDSSHLILSLLFMILIYILTTGGFSGTSVGLILQHLPFGPQQI
jgi:polyferredoxin